MEPTQLQTKSLWHSNHKEDYDLYKAALEWDLIEPIVIEDRKDIRSETKWKELLKPFHHQVTNLVTFCRRLPVTLLADDVGLGKTISAGLIISELMVRGRVSKILIVCPKLLIPQWKEELETKFNVPAVEAIGSKISKTKLPDNTGAVITTYQSARMHMDAIGKLGFDMLILDEAHKLRNLYGTDKAPQVALRFKEALANRLFKYVLMLTATPIQNRLWDIYSLVDLLTVAKGHENPFGNPGIFARKYIADKSEQARHLNLEKKDEFRNIVANYMSRVRRGDANLYFPSRIVQLHKVQPTLEEKEIIGVIKKYFNDPKFAKKISFFSQIIILQLAVSSPEALVRTLKNMAKNETVPQSFSDEVKVIADKIKYTSKLKGLASLVHKLRSEQPDNWRMIVFTRWRETQTTIQAFLEENGIKCGLINGDSGEKNQNTIKKLKANPPEINVIVSTEAGSEGVNLQAANVLVNYDLPWNPMIVEQRIGRIQRLASEHATVCIFNIILEGTFEEYIVGRLMEKLQMASHAIGDIEALLEASGLDEGDEDNDESTSGFEEKILKLVLSSLAGKDMEAATRSAEQSIVEAKTVLETEAKNIDTMLGGMGDDYGPQTPKLPIQERSMEAKEFVLSSLKKIGAKLSEQSAGLYTSTLDGRRELISFGNKSDLGTSTLYIPGSPAFERLVSKITSNSLHSVNDLDKDPLKDAEKIANDWINKFGAKSKTSSLEEVYRNFEGNALLRVRITVAHDSYERLVTVECPALEHIGKVTRNNLDAVNEPLNPVEAGVQETILSHKALQDPGVVEFCRFYNERMQQEIEAGGKDQRKRKKLEDDFTPRIEIALVGLEGNVKRLIKLKSTYHFDNEQTYQSTITVIPNDSKVIESPEFGNCEITNQSVPTDCLVRCEITGKNALKHLLIKSAISDRYAIPEKTVVCALSGKRVLVDEAEQSSVSGDFIISSMLQESSVSGKKAEPKYFVKCAFTGVDLLEDESGVSQISRKVYRLDEELRSSITGKAGHKNEFIYCAVTKQPLIEIESEKCAVTGKVVAPGILEECEVTGKMVLPSELERSAVSGKKGLKKFFVTSSISAARILEKEALISTHGEYCSLAETKSCSWSGQKCHPTDLKICFLTGLPIYLSYLTTDNPPKLEVLSNLLNGISRNAEKSDTWDVISKNLSSITGGKCKIESSELSPDGKHLAVVIEIKTLLGLKQRVGAAIVSLGGYKAVGRIAIGKRDKNSWNIE
jgi:superfamily II DNA or RNA helicase